MPKHILRSLILLLTAKSLLAQEPVPRQWTLEECVDHALKNNIQIRQATLNTDLANAELLQSEANLLPAVNGNASHSYNIGRTIDRFTNQFANAQVLSQNFYLSADITLFSGFQNLNAIRQSRASYMAAKFDVEKIRNDVSLNVATAYLQVLYSMELLEVAQSQARITSSQLERTTKLVQAGAAAKGSELDMQAQLATEELNVTNAQNQRDIALLSLAQLLNLPDASGFSVVKPDLSAIGEQLVASSVEQIVGAAEKNLPDLQAAELKVRSAEIGVRQAWGGLSPRLTFNASIGTGYSGLAERIIGMPSFDGFMPNGSFTSAGDTVYSPVFTDPVFEKIPYADQYRDNVNKTFGFYLYVPIFNRFQTRTAISRARINRMNAELDAESSRLQIRKTIQQAYADANAGMKKYISGKKAVEAGAESFRYTEQKFNVGMINSQDYNMAKNNLAKAQSDLIQAKYEYVFKMKVLDFYQGEPLKF